MPTEPRRTLVTGSQGFIGRHFCSRYGGSPLADADGNVNLSDVARIQAAVNSLRPEGVVHLAAQSSVASSLSDPEDTYVVNFLGTFHLLSALEAIQFTGTFVYVSSADVYGKVAEVDLPAKEHLATRPRSPYAVSKVAAEALCYQWSQTQAFPVVVMRLFNQLGPGHDRRFAIPDFANQIIEIKRGLRPASISTGDLDVTRDFTDVRDTIRAIHLALESGRNGETYNICSGQECTLRSLVEELLDLAGVKAELLRDSKRTRPVEQRRMVGDFTKIREHLGWTPRVPLRTTLEDILKDVEDGRNG